MGGGGVLGPPANTETPEECQVISGGLLRNKEVEHGHPMP